MKSIICPVKMVSEIHPNQVAVVAAGRNILYKDLNTYIERGEYFFKKIGVKAEDRIAVLGPNSMEYIIVLIALWRIGAIACPLSIRNPRSNTIIQLGKLKCRNIIVSKEYENYLGSNDGKVIKMADMIFKGDIDIPSEDPKLSREQEATIIFTSGSSSARKAVVHTFGNHYFNAKGANENIPVSSSSRWLLSLPLYHVSGLGILFRCMLGGGTIVLPGKDEGISSSLERYSVTHISLVTTQLFRLLHDTYSVNLMKNMKAILLGGSTVPDILIHKSKEHDLPLYTTYGLTEMASQVATTKMYSLEGEAKACTSVLNYCEVKVSSEDEILVKGETLFKGYWENGKTVTGSNDEGWFETGDIGSFDEKGCLTVTGRKDNMFISGGENIHPEEIERHILNTGKVEEAVVVRIEDKEFGARPVAFIRQKLGEDIEITEIISYLQDKLPRYKIPEFFYSWPVNYQQSGIKIRRQFFEDLAEREHDRLEVL